MVTHFLRIDHMAYLTSSHESADSIANYISGLKALHGLAKKEFPKELDYKTKIELRGVQREKVHPIKQAAPITPEILLKPGIQH